MTRIGEKLTSAVDVLLTGQGSLQLRLFCVAGNMSDLRPEDFSDANIRDRFVALRSDFVMLGFGTNDEPRPFDDLNRADAILLALRFLALCFDVATHDRSR